MTKPQRPMPFGVVVGRRDAVVGHFYIEEIKRSMRLPFSCSILTLILLSVGFGRSEQACHADSPDASFPGLSFPGSSFPGWQGLRVIEQKGRPSVMRAGDLDGDGREELVVVNSRNSRLDIYAWREEPPQSGMESVAARLEDRGTNELPLAPDLERQELQLENVPRDVLVQDLDGDVQPELVVLASSPNQVAVYRRHSPADEKGAAADDNGAAAGDKRAAGNNQRAAANQRRADWEMQYKIDLLDGDIPAGRHAMLIRQQGNSLELH